MATAAQLYLYYGNYDDPIVLRVFSCPCYFFSVNFSFFSCSGRESIILYACDCSNEALERTKETIAVSDSTSAIHRFHPFLCDFSTTGFPSWLVYNNRLGFSGAFCYYM